MLQSVVLTKSCINARLGIGEQGDVASQQRPHHLLLHGFCYVSNILNFVAGFALTWASANSVVLSMLRRGSDRATCFKKGVVRNQSLEFCAV